jgi:LmbE family N-acetylglucosaminyl deacetylase
VHAVRTGRSGPYTRAAVVEDLARALEVDRPSDVYVAHPFDAHPDHASTYLLLRDALDAVRMPVRVHRAMVHAGPCWPAGSSAAPPCASVRETLGTPLPPLPAPLAGWVFDERVPVPDGGRRKRAVIAGYASQIEAADPADDWLASFGRADEVFETEHIIFAEGHAGRRDGAREALRRRWGAGEPMSLGREGTDDAVVLRCGPDTLSLTAFGLVRAFPLPSSPDDGCEVVVWQRGADGGGLAELEVRVDGVRRALWPWTPSLDRDDPDHR